MCLEELYSPCFLNDLRTYQDEYIFCCFYGQPGRVISIGREPVNSRTKIK